MLEARSRMPMRPYESSRPDLPAGNPLPSSATSRAAASPSQRPADGRGPGVGVTLDVDEGLLRDPPHLPLLQDRETGPTAVAVDTHVELGPVGEPSGELLQDRADLRTLRHIGPEVVEGVTHLADHTSQIVPQLI